MTGQGDPQRCSILVNGDTTAERVIPTGGDLPNNCTVIEAEDFAVMPGLVNAHTHGHGGLSKGTGDRWTLELLLNAGGWIGGNRTDDDRYLSTLLTAVEMLQKGCTACFDLSLAAPLPTSDRSVASSRSGLSGCRHARCGRADDVAISIFTEQMPGLFDAATPGMRQDMERAAGTAGASILPALAKIASDWSFPSDRLQLGIAPTIPLHSTDEFLLGCHEIAREHGLAFQTHLAESNTQAVAATIRYGHSTTMHLANLGLVDAKFSGAHGVWLDANDMLCLGENNAAIAHNPGSNLRLGSGIADVVGLLEKGVKVGIGTDGGASADGQNMFEATRLACNLSRVKGRTSDQWLEAIDAHRLATSGSARILGMQDQIGRIAPGYKADLVFLDLTHVNYVPLNNLIHQVVHVEDGTAVRHVMVGGRMVVKDRNVLTVDVESLRQKSAAAAERLRAANAETRAIAERLAPLVGRFCNGLACKCAVAN